jgi:predicted RNase H-like nuclease (RuvC/YqgF family)
MNQIQFNKINGVLGIIVLMAIYIIINTNGIKTDVRSYKNKIESLQDKIDSTKSINVKIGHKIDSVKEKVTIINKEIHHIDKTITTVKIKTNEKINSINKLSNPELEHFFSNRYNSTIQGN